MTPPVKKLFDLEIDEVSVVDRPANQHGLITFAKSAGLLEAVNQEDTMPDDEIFDAEGAAVDPEVLEHGDVVYDAEGTEYVFVEEGQEAPEVEKALNFGALNAKAKTFGAQAKQFAQGASAGVKKGPATVGGAGGAGYKAGSTAWGNRTGFQRGLIAGAPVAAGTGAVGYATAKKSLGDEILEELSKAVNDTDRDEIIAKALNEVEVYKAQADAMAEQLAEIEEARIEDAFISKAAEYNLPVAPEVLGPILKAAATVLTEEQLDVLDSLFESVGDTLYQEVGYVGDTSNSSVMDQVNAYAGELVGKADVSEAEAIVKAFENNPAAYEAYLAEQNGR